MDNQNFDEATLERLYLRMERRLYNVVYRWVWSRHDAQEIIQETFLRLWDMRARVELNTVEPLTYRIALNLVRKRARRKKLLEWVGLVEHEVVVDARPNMDLMMECEERDQRVRDAVEALPSKYRDVILLCEFSEMTHAEIAAALGIKEGTVASRRHEAKSRLQSALNTWHTTEDV